jgi:hypothetical protein
MPRAGMSIRRCSDVWPLHENLLSQGDDRKQNHGLDGENCNHPESKKRLCPAQAQPRQLVKPNRGHEETEIPATDECCVGRARRYVC